MAKKIKFKKIPASDVMVGWMCNEDDRVNKLIVISSNNMTDEIDSQYDYWDGNCSKGWGKGDFRTTPAGLFAYIASEYGFQSRETAYNALKEFSKIRNQSWAHLTRKSMDGELV